MLQETFVQKRHNHVYKVISWLKQLSQVMSLVAERWCTRTPRVLAAGGFWKKERFDPLFSSFERCCCHIDCWRLWFGLPHYERGPEKNSGSDRFLSPEYNLQWINPAEENFQVSSPSPRTQESTLFVHQREYIRDGEDPRPSLLVSSLKTPNVQGKK